ncbi:MAG: aminopeptidase [Erysipelotrichaceae bacterium]|nr:aminopeptidase [Erysipelotrichaceae bacterium]
MIKQDILRKYAKLAVCVGTNIQPGQPLLINAPVECAEFVRLCVEEAYKAQASYVLVEWNDELSGKLSYEYASVETLEDIPQYRIDSRAYLIEKNYALLSISARTPGLLAGIDAVKMQRVQMASSKAFKAFMAHTMGNKTQWSVISVPTVGWAKKVFPTDSDSEAVNKLWDAILKAVRITEDNDPVTEWEIHNERLHHYTKTLNAFNFRKLHFRNSIGTDLTVGLVKNHIWAGGCEVTTGGVIFNPNMPTEECFCMPDKYHVDGIVYATKPLNHNGKLIEGFNITFQDGKAVSYHADKEEGALKNLIEFDEGSCYLGEVALISHRSPISLSNILFYNTLFDENASCHLALGAAYPMNVQGGTAMSEEELSAAGANRSMEHSDFMFGSADMEIIGINEKGEEFTIFEKGNFVI